MTLSMVYRDQTGGAPLWQEIQNVALDGEGKYSVLMGATQSEGMPLELFASGEPRWVGVQFNRPGEGRAASRVAGQRALRAQGFRFRDAGRQAGFGLSSGAKTAVTNLSGRRDCSAHGP